jgi:hypothetical protein
MAGAPAKVLSPEFHAMIARGVSAIVASRDAAHTPSIMRAVGSAISDDGTLVTVFLARTQSRQLLQDVAATGCIAVVFSQPSTHRTVQLKARSAQIRAAVPADEAALALYLGAMEHELALIGLGAAFARAMLAYRLDDLVAVSFTPEEAFDQTPGPRAGAQLAAGAG